MGRHSRRSDDFTYVSSYVKYSLFFFNVVFWLFGGTMVGIGGWSFLEEYSESGLPEVKNVFDVLLQVSIVLMVVGAVVFSISFSGCLGALRENTCLLKFYSFLLLILFLGELVLGTLAFVFPNTLTDWINQGLSQKLVENYRDNANFQNLIDAIQKEFRCCGISDKGYKDWSQNQYFNCSAENPSPERCAVPYSCCRENANSKSQTALNEKIYTRGCVEGLMEFVKGNLYLVAGICLGVALVQLFAMYLSRTLLNQITLQRARWA
ncbi:tetraspanin-33-like [Limulus polyphemus]|uniref:Tetraspanin n=1 Tax=Limulus polyphemus TaxID=6850 RepID=A0ABM1BC15_LIMPO|nr:tetraspanin-33-like [Limulus polyphemus]